MNIKVTFSKIKIFSFYALLLYIVYGLSNKFNSLDYDFWARLIAGQHVVQTGSVMYKDVLSYTPTHTWYDPEWLSSAFLYLITNTFGIASVTVTKFILVFLSIVSVTLGVHFVYKHKLNSLHLEYFILILFLSFLGGSSGIFLRCQLFSYIFIPIWIILLEKISQNYDTPKAKPYLISLPFVMLLWLNLHGACVAGVGIMVLFILGRILNRKPVKKYLLALIPVCLVFFINPWGYEYILYTLHSATLDRSWIIEWKSPISHTILFSDVNNILLIILMVLYIISLAVSKFKNINFSKMLILFATYYLAWAHFKHAPLFAVTAGVYLYEDYVFLAQKIFGFIYKKLKIDEICQKYLGYLKDILVHIIVFGAATYLTIMAPVASSLVETSFASYPIGPVEFILENDIKGNMFLPYFYGSFMAYKTYPNIKIFMDGRQEQVYDYDLFDGEMFFMYGLHKNTRPIVEDYVPDIYIVERNWEYGNYVHGLTGYKEIYNDGVYGIFIKENMAKPSYHFTGSHKIDTYNILDNNIDFRRSKK